VTVCRRRAPWREPRRRLARRWKSPLGEIDIVARRRRLLVFVEVKARASLDEAAESVTPHRRQRIAAAAEIWLAGNSDDSVRDIRLDAILVARQIATAHPGGVRRRVMFRR
jgi:putative endonuclease